MTTQLARLPTSVPCDETGVHTCLPHGHSTVAGGLSYLRESTRGLPYLDEGTDNMMVPGLFPLK